MKKSINPATAMNATTPTPTPAPMLAFCAVVSPATAVDVAVVEDVEYGAVELEDWVVIAAVWEGVEEDFEEEEEELVVVAVNAEMDARSAWLYRMETPYPFTASVEVCSVASITV